VRLLTCPADDCPVVLFDSLSDPAREFCPTCSTPGATDSTLEWAVRATVPGKAESLSRPAVGWSEPA
jgi:hypothetical protein